MNFFSSSKKDKTKKIPANAEQIILKLKQNKYYEFCMGKCTFTPGEIANEPEHLCLMQCSDQVHNYLASSYTELIALKSKF